MVEIQRFSNLTRVTFMYYVYIFCQITELVLEIIALVTFYYFMKKIINYIIYHFEIGRRISTKLIIYLFSHLFSSILL